MHRIYNYMKRTITSSKGKVLENLVVKDQNQKFTDENCQRRN